MQVWKKLIVKEQWKDRMTFWLVKSIECIYIEGMRHIAVDTQMLYIKLDSSTVGLVFLATFIFTNMYFFAIRVKNVNT